MNSVLTIKAPAKINLGLTVLRRRPDGYHDLSSVMQQISLADTIRLEPQREPGCSFYCSEPSLAGKDNLVCRAAALLVERAALGASLPGVKISLYKHIPAAAGLGGGSSDAAAALKALNVFWKLALSMEQLVEIGALLGSDIPYCLRGGTGAGRRGGGESYLSAGASFLLGHLGPACRNHSIHGPSLQHAGAGAVFASTAGTVNQRSPGAERRVAAGLVCRRPDQYPGGGSFTSLFLPGNTEKRVSKSRPLSGHVWKRPCLFCADEKLYRRPVSGARLAGSREPCFFVLDHTLT